MDSITTYIKAAFIIAFDGQKHRILRNGEIAYRESKIIYVGSSFRGHAVNLKKEIERSASLILGNLGHFRHSFILLFNSVMAGG